MIRVVIAAATLALTADLALAQTATPHTAATPETTATPQAAATPAKPAPAPARLTPADAIPALAPAAAPAGEPLFAAIAAGGASWTLGESTLADVARAFGGKPDEGGPEGAPAAWLCFAGTAAGRPSIFWFVSDGDAEAQPLTRIAVEPQDDRGAGPCMPAPPALDGIDAGTPGPGARLADLRGALGDATPGPRGHVHYSVSIATPNGGAAAQTAIYSAAAGKVAGLSLGQIATD